MEFLQLAKDRYSCKSYRGDPITKEELEYILEAGRHAPTAKNLQEQRIYVVQTPAGLKKIDEITPCRYNAPVVLAVGWDTDNVFTYPGGERNSEAEDAAIVAAHMMLAAKDIGVDSCWVNNFNPAAAKAILGLPDNEEVLMLLDLGYPSENGKPLPNHYSRRPIEETTLYI